MIKSFHWSTGIISETINVIKLNVILKRNIIINYKIENNKKWWFNFNQVKKFEKLNIITNSKIR